MKRIALLVELLLLWLLPVAWLLSCFDAFRHWEPSTIYSNSGAYLFMAFLWLTSVKKLKAVLPAHRIRIWGTAVALCFTAWLAGVIFFVVYPMSWAFWFVMIPTVIVVGLTMPDDPEFEAQKKAAAERAKARKESGRASTAVLLTILLLLIGVGGFVFYSLSVNGDGLRKEQLLAFFGSTEARVSLGWRYREGDGVPQDFSKAALWFEKAASSGSAKAQYDLGILRYYHLGTSEGADKARESFEQAAQQDYPPAVTMLGQLAAQEEHNPQKAIALWQRAISLKDVWAEYLLGSMYLSMRSSPKNEKNIILALFWLEKARRDGVEPIGGMLQHVWATVPDESVDRVTDEVFRGLRKGTPP
jgi:TPR repeat protein